MNLGIFSEIQSHDETQEAVQAGLLRSKALRIPRPPMLRGRARTASALSMRLGRQSSSRRELGVSFKAESCWVMKELIALLILWSNSFAGVVTSHGHTDLKI